MPYEIGNISKEKRKLIYQNHYNGKKNNLRFISGQGSNLKNTYYIF